MRPYRNKDYLLEGLKEQYTYDEKRGCLIWKKSFPENKIYAGNVAGRFKKGDFSVTYRGKEYSARRVAFLLHWGEFPTGALYVRDGNPENLRPENLVLGKVLAKERLSATCQHCGTNFFYNNKYHPSKFCSQACYMASRLKNRPKECRDCSRKLSEADRATVGRRCDSCSKAHRRTRELARKYGMSTIDFEALVAKQNGVCAICGTAPDSGPVVDHDHNTGAVRGVLCSPCNTGLGMFKDSVERLGAAISYLTTPRHTQSP